MRVANRGLVSSLILFAGLVSVAGLAVAVPYTDIVVFGDSLSDAGNFYEANAYPPPPYFNGQFSNGPVWATTFSQHFGFSGAPSSAGGQNYAYAGATTGPTGVATTAPSLLAQESSYLATHGGVGD